MDNKAIVLDLLQRSRSRLNGVAAIFKEAGIDLNSDGPSVQQFEALNQYHPEQFEKVINFLYPEKVDEKKANGTAWAQIVGAACSGVGSIFSAIGSSDADGEYQQLQYEKALAEQQAAQQKKTLYIVLGLIAGVAVIGVALYFLMSTRR